MNQNGVVVWEGESRITGAPIVAIATGLKNRSANAKTGAMVQTWILVADIDPLEALKTGADSANCGACIFKAAGHDGTKYWGRECYVNVSQAPLNVWRTWRRGRYASPPLSALPSLFAGRFLRFGSYGDPAAVPVEVWRAMAADSAGWTGYTHQSRSERLRDVLEFCQVSADTLEDAQASRRAGVGSFRVLASGESPAPFEILCPASKEAGQLTDCQSCRLCSGHHGASIAIASHGIGAGLSPRPERRPLRLPVLNPERTAMV